MLITLQFDTEKEDDYNLHKTYIKAIDMSLALWDIKTYLRNLRKYKSEKLSKESFELVEKLEEDLLDIISNYGLLEIIE